MNRRPPPVPPRPELERRPTGAFGWLDAVLLHDDWLAEVGPHAAATLVLLALAADRRGVSFFGRDRMAVALGMSRHEVDVALQRLLDASLVAREGGMDGLRGFVRARRHDPGQIDGWQGLIRELHPVRQRPPSARIRSNGGRSR